MSTITKRCINPNLPWLNGKKVQYFLYHNGNVHSRRGTSLTNYFFNCILIFFWIVFFILFRKISWMRTLITNSSLMCSLFLCLILFLHICFLSMWFLNQISSQSALLLTHKSGTFIKNCSLPLTLLYYVSNESYKTLQ